LHPKRLGLHTAIIAQHSALCQRDRFHMPNECYLISAPTFETKSEKYSWLNNIQAVGKMVEYKIADHLIYDLFVVK